jgi:hypothetical protein
MVSVISIDESNRWDEIVRSFGDYDVYYLSEYTKAFKIHGDGEPNLFYYEGKDTRAINVVMKRDVEKDKNFLGKIPKDSYFDLVTPYGYGGFLIEGDKSVNSIKLLNDEYSAFCKNNGIISEFVRFHPILENHKNLDVLYDVLTLGKTVSIDLKSTEQIWNDLTSKNRNMIRKAKKLGVEIYCGLNSEMFDEFIKLYNATMDKDNATEYYYFKKDFYNSVLNDLKDNAHIFYAVFEGSIIAMSIIVFANQQIHYHLSASDREYQNVAPTNLLLYEAACWGCNNGYKTFHLGGGLGSRKDSLYKFKKAFNRNYDNEFVIGKKIFDELKYGELLLIRGSGLESSSKQTFFPLYRA